jgi:hypothetical protein
MKTGNLLLLALCACANGAVAAAASLDLFTARLTVDNRGVVTELAFADGTRWPSAAQPAFSIDAGGRTYGPRSVDVGGDRWTVRFVNGATAEFHVTLGRGFALFRLGRLQPRDGVTRLQLFRLVKSVRQSS